MCILSVCSDLSVSLTQTVTCAWQPLLHCGPTVDQTTITNFLLLLEHCLFHLIQYLCLKSLPSWPLFNSHTPHRMKTSSILYQNLVTILHIMT